VVDFTVLNRAQRNRLFYPADMEAVATNCPHCSYVGGALNASTSIHYLNHQLDDVAVYGHSPTMVEIDTRTVETGRYFTEVEDLHAVEVCLIGDHVVHEFFEGVTPIGRTIRAGGAEYTVIGTFEKIGSVLGRDQDNFIIIPLRTFLKDRGQRNSLTISVKTDGPNSDFVLAQDDTRRVLRARRHVQPGKEDDFFIGTSESYITGTGHGECLLLLTFARPFFCHHCAEVFDSKCTSARSRESEGLSRCEHRFLLGVSTRIIRIAP
jgi:hypothetical protein